MDGKNHINIYSKGQTQIGRWLSNFTYHPIITEDGPFDSIEGYWYWLGCPHPDKDLLRTTSGFRAKQLGRELGSLDWPPGSVFKQKISEALRIKILTAPEGIREALVSNTLPFYHYYVYNGKNKMVPNCKWIIKAIEKAIMELRG